MTSTYSVLGMEMQRQMARRRLVVVAYGVLAGFCGASLILARTNPFMYSWTIFATMAVASFVFGGTGRYGLVKPFPNKPPRAELPVIEAVRLQMSPMSAGTPEETSWRNDERELSRRDRAHYQAFPWTGLLLFGALVMATFGLRSALGLRHPQWLTPAIALQAIYATALVGSVLVVTLPAAIILWMEPDMDVA